MRLMLNVNNAGTKAMALEARFERLGVRWFEERGVITVPDGPGLGIRPDREALRRRAWGGRRTTEVD